MCYSCVSISVGNLLVSNFSFTTTESSSLPESHEPIQVDDEGTDEDVEAADENCRKAKRKRTSVVWKEFKEVEVRGVSMAQCTYCKKKLSAKGGSGTNHLHAHLRTCTMRKIKLGGLKTNKTLTQSSLRMKSEGGKMSIEHYTYDQDVARKALASMIVLHEYPLCLVDHIGFRRFVSALQPLFKMVTRNTIR
jgi:hypothetical protein